MSSNPWWDVTVLDMTLEEYEELQHIKRQKNKIDIDEDEDDMEDAFEGQPPEYPSSIDTSDDRALWL